MHARAYIRNQQVVQKIAQVLLAVCTPWESPEIIRLRTSSVLALLSLCPEGHTGTFLSVDVDAQPL